MIGGDLVYVNSIPNISCCIKFLVYTDDMVVLKTARLLVRCQLTAIARGNLGLDSVPAPGRERRENIQ